MNTKRQVNKIIKLKKDDILVQINEAQFSFYLNTEGTFLIEGIIVEPIPQTIPVLEKITSNTQTKRLKEKKFPIIIVDQHQLIGAEFIFGSNISYNYQIRCISPNGMVCSFPIKSSKILSSNLYTEIQKMSNKRVKFLTDQIFERQKIEKKKAIAKKTSDFITFNQISEKLVIKNVAQLNQIQKEKQVFDFFTRKKLSKKYEELNKLRKEKIIYDENKKEDLLSTSLINCKNNNKKKIPPIFYDFSKSTGKNFLFRSFMNTKRESFDEVELDSKSFTIKPFQHKF